MLEVIYPENGNTGRCVSCRLATNENDSIILAKSSLSKDKWYLHRKCGRSIANRILRTTRASLWRWKVDKKTGRINQ